MTLAKTPEDVSKLYEYLKSLEKSGIDIKVSKISDFIEFCIKGRYYFKEVDNDIVAVLCMYETKRYLFAPHVYIVDEYRNKMLIREMYQLGVKYCKDKGKKIYTTPNDLENLYGLKNFFTKTIMADGRIFYQGNMNRNI